MVIAINNFLFFSGGFPDVDPFFTFIASEKVGTRWLSDFCDWPLICFENIWGELIQTSLLFGNRFLDAANATKSLELIASFSLFSLFYSLFLSYIHHVLDFVVDTTNFGLNSSIEWI